MQYDKTVKELIQAYDNYINILGEEINELVNYSQNEHWTSSRIEQGQEARDQINQIKKALWKTS